MKIKVLITSLACLLLFMAFACETTAQEPGSAVEYISSPEVAKRNLPFSEVVKAGNTLYLAGKLGRVPETGKLAEGGIQGETRQALENIKAVLESQGATMDNIVKVTVFLADIEEWGAMNEVYKTYFNKHFPARSAVGAIGLGGGARVEIECIAVIP